MFTEEEANKKLCPIWFIGNAISVRHYPDNKERKLPIAVECIASRCMMWWWYDGMQTKGCCGLAK